MPSGISTNFYAFLISPIYVTSSDDLIFSFITVIDSDQDVIYSVSTKSLRGFEKLWRADKLS
jgi:hypothetical protein